MLTNPTIDMLRDLGLSGIASAYQELDTQPEAKHLEHRARAANLRHDAQLENIDFRATRGLDRNLFLKLAGCDWIRQRHSILMIGPAGVGKSWLSCALEHKPRGLLRYLSSAPEALRDPGISAANGRYPKVLEALARTDLLSLDDWGPEKLNDEQRRDLLEIVEERYEKRSTIVTSQVPIKHWDDMIGNPTIADAVLDCLVHNAYRIELSGESMRKQRSVIAAETIHA